MQSTSCATCPSRPRTRERGEGRGGRHVRRFRVWLVLVDREVRSRPGEREDVVRGVRLLARARPIAKGTARQARALHHRGHRGTARGAGELLDGVIVIAYTTTEA